MIIKKVHILIATLSLSTALFAQKADNSTFDEGVIINGIKWATRNVDKPGTFAAKPEDAGMFYQWNCKIGWSATEPIINSNGGTIWDVVVSESSKWKRANDPSPNGWRVPTKKELRTLLNTKKVNQEGGTENGISGKRFTDKTTGNSIFLPAVGYRNYSDGALYRVGEFGFYWSGTRDGIYSAYNVGFCSWDTGGGPFDCFSGLSLRSVAE